MSLVNDMLRDLDDRQRKDTGAYASVPAKKKNRTPIWGLIIVLLAIAAFVGVERSGFDYKGLLSSFMEPKSDIEPKPEQTQVTEVASQAIETDELADSSVAAKTAPAPLKEPQSVLNQVTAIRWTLLEPHRGNLSFWLDTVKPFTVHERTPKRLDIEIQYTSFAADLPPSLEPLLSSISFQKEGASTRFIIESKEGVEFKPELKRAPPRLKIEVISPSIQQATTVVETPDNKVKEPASSDPDETVEQEETREQNETSQVVTQKEQTSEPVSQGEWKKTLNAPLSDSGVVRDARRLLSQGKTDQAINKLKSFVAKSSKSYQSKYLLTQLYIATGDYTSVKEQFVSAPDNLSWALLKARTALQQGDASTALSLLDRFSEGESRSDYLELKAAALQQKGFHQKAVEHYLQLLELNSQQARWWVNMGVSFEYLGQAGQAVDAYRSALKIPDVDPASANYANQQLQRLLSSSNQ